MNTNPTELSFNMYVVHFPYLLTSTPVQPHHLINNPKKNGTASMLLDGVRMTAEMKEKSASQRKRTKQTAENKRNKEGALRGELSTREPVNVGG